MYFFDLESIQAKQLLEGIMIKVVYGDRIMMSFVDLDAGAIVPEHTHEHEQMGYVFSGTLNFHIGNETQVCQPGDTYLIPSHIPHKVIVSDDAPAKVLDIFSPPREEYK